MKRVMTGDELVDEIAEVLRQGNGAFIAEIANKVLVPQVTYDGDSLFTQELDGGEEESSDLNESEE